MSTCELIYGLTVHTVRVAVPPEHPAGIRAEFFRFAPGTLFYWLPALFASDGVRQSIGVKAVPVAKGAHRII